MLIMMASMLFVFHLLVVLRETVVIKKMAMMLTMMASILFAFCPLVVLMGTVVIAMMVMMLKDKSKDRGDF